LYPCETLLSRLVQDLQDVAAEPRPCIQQAPAVVRQRHLARHGYLAAADQPGLRNRVVQPPTRARGHHRLAPTGAAGDAELMHASCEGQSVSSRPGRFHPHRQRHQLMQIN
jgi:hypothetical protein